MRATHVITGHHCFTGELVKNPLQYLTQCLGNAEYPLTNDVHWKLMQMGGYKAHTRGSIRALVISVQLITEGATNNSKHMVWLTLKMKKNSISSLPKYLAYLRCLQIISTGR
ncbi:hypothetical protein O3P69_014431 [Scylla paramamosain]|uniref:Uncharacterized protein n=1 Tax=Scylla paramamosain TaxID=85552 RepID=A0AAW0TC37_SCYPA